jgi:UDP-glucose:(heptosyl)LPS alpha-1,3-glucosyltransferase
MNIIQVVRRYGPVGGMERYVWELTRELRNLGHEVTVLCEVCLTEPIDGITVHELGALRARPRWLAYLRFSRRVENWLKAHPQTDGVIHSHERLNSHHVTTFHGPPFVTVRDMPWWRKVSLRVAMLFYLERRELRVTQHIVPNSEFIKRQLADYYPEFAEKLTKPIVPGVVSGTPRPARLVPKDGGVIGFVGKEWQRKGLPLAVEIVAQLRQTRPQLQFVVIGVPPADIQSLFADWQGGYQLQGWHPNAPYPDFDVLLHPAKAEPYGMVISEAMATAVPVVISDRCGAAAQVSPASGEVLSLDAPVADWVAAVQNQLNRTTPVPPFVRSWQEMAREYVQVYQNILLTRI